MKAVRLTATRRGLTFAVFKEFIDKGIALADLYAGLRKRLRLDGSFDELTLYHLSLDMTLAFS